MSIGALYAYVMSYLVSKGAMASHLTIMLHDAASESGVKLTDCIVNHFLYRAVCTLYVTVCIILYVLLNVSEWLYQQGMQVMYIAYHYWWLILVV